MKGVILDKATVGKVDLPAELRALCEWEIYENVSFTDVPHLISEKDIVLTNKVPLNAMNLEGSKVKYIGVLATGTNVIDVDYCAEKGIEVKNAVGYSTDSVAQHTFTMLLSFMGRTAYFDEYIKTNQYASSPMFTHLGYEYSEIKGKKWGIIGLGNIGKKVADIATVFGAEVSYFSTSRISRSDMYQMVDLASLLAESDIVSIHAPLNQSTHGLMNYENISKMKPSSILVNVGRGGIVVEDDLIQALNENKIKGACLDVFEEEPFDFEAKYKKLEDKDKLLVSPHIAWASVEARKSLLDITCQNLKSWVMQRDGII